MDREARELMLELAQHVLNLVSELEEAQDVFEPNKYAKEMSTYDRAIAWLQEQNKE